MIRNKSPDNLCPILNRIFSPFTWMCLTVALLILTIHFGPFSAALAQQTYSKEREGKVIINDRVSVDMYGGYLKGQSREIVYDNETGRKKSELLWVIDDAYVVGGAISFRPVDWLTLRLSGWTPLKSKNTMNDYDWELTGHGDWSDLSHHPDTRINHAGMIDAGAKAQIASFGVTKLFDHAALNLLAGFRWFNISWTSYGGSGVYSAGGGYRNDNRLFPEGEAGLAYEQWLNMPYIGIGGSMSRGRWTAGAELTGSLWGWGSSKDNHYDRALLFEDQFSKISMVGGDIYLSYALAKNFDLIGRFVYTKYLEAQGPTTMTNYLSGEITHFTGNAAGMDNQSMLFNLGIRWKLF